MKISELKRGLIVSCQATPEEPMRDSAIIGRFALAAEIGGAVAVRVNGMADILAAKQLINIPLIGLIKHQFPGYWCYITPVLRDVESVYHTGAEIVAVDATSLPKPGGLSTESFIREIKKRFPDLLLMGDISTLDEGLAAEQAGADLLSTTLAGYTPHTKSSDMSTIIELQPPDVDLVGQLAQRVKVPVVAEGRYWDETFAIQAFEAGAHNVVIGAGITRPQIITQKIVCKLQPYL